MTIKELAGSVLIAFAIPAAIICISFLNKPIRLISLLLGMFAFSLCSIVSAMLCKVCDMPIVLIIISFVCVQEFVRYILTQTLKLAKNSGRYYIIWRLYSRTFGFDIGLGFGIGNGVMYFSNIIRELQGPATAFLSFIQLLNCCCWCSSIILLHALWNVIISSTIVNPNVFKTTCVVVSHLLLSSVNLLNQFELYMSVAFIFIIVTVITAIVGYKCVGGSYDKFKLSLFK